jgi:hypothetical protein
MKWLKGILWVGLAIIVLFAAGLALASFYKQELLEEIRSQLKDATGADITIADAEITVFADFPRISLRLEGVRIAEPDSAIAIDLLHCENVTINLHAYKLLKKEIGFGSIMLKDGKFFAYRGKSGHSNLDMFRRKEKTDTTTAVTNLELTDEDVSFENIHVSYHDSLRRKFFDFQLSKVNSRVTRHDSLLNLLVNGSVDFGRMLFNEERGSFLKDIATEIALSVRIRTDSFKLMIDPSTVFLDESQVGISGTFNFVDRSIALSFASQDMMYHEALAVIPEKIADGLKIMSVEKPFAVQAEINTPMGGEQPAVDITFQFKDNVFQSTLATINKLSLEGQMTNHLDETLPFNNINSSVELKNVRGEIDGLPFKADARLWNFNDIGLHTHSIHEVPLVDVNRQVDTTLIRFTKGKFYSEFDYTGKLNEYFNENTGRITGQLTGTASIDDGAFILVERKLKLDQINTKIRFTQDTVWINSFSIAAGMSKLNLKGEIANYVPFFARPAEKGYVRATISSPSIDLQSFLARKKSTKVRKAKSTDSRKKVSDMIDEIFKNLELDVTLNIGKLVNRTFNVTGVKGRVQMKGTSLTTKNLKMNYCGGRLDVAFALTNLHKPINTLDVNAKVSGVRIGDMFRSFDNFSQKAIVDKNLSGTVSLNTKFKARINDDFNVLMPSLNGTVDMTIKNGRLIDVKAFEKISNFLFKRRDFSDVRFAQINGRFKLANRDLDISRMEIQSTVLSLFLEGKYSLDNKADLTIQLPLSNLKKRDKTFVPQNLGVDTKVGASIFLLAKTNEAGETEISYDPFHKRKTKKEAAKKGNK